MLKWIESTGKTEDAAIEAALVKLGMDRDEVSVEILERAKSGFLGIGSCPAKVKVTYEAPDEPEPAPAPSPEPVPAVKKEPPRPVAAEKPAPPRTPEHPAPAEKPESAPAAAAAEDKTGRIVEFMTGLLAHMGADARPVVKQDPQGNYQVELVGEIGRAHV